MNQRLQNWILVRGFYLITILSSLSANAESFTPIQTFTGDISTTSIQGDNFGTPCFLHPDGNYLFIASPTSRPDGLVTGGAVYIYKKTSNGWEKTQTLTGTGFGSHLGAGSIQAHGKWLFIPAVGTPLDASSAGDLDVTGSVLIYKLDDDNDLWKFKQALNRYTPGLEDLTVSSPEGLNPTNLPQKFQQGASFGFNFSLDLARGLLLVAAQYQQNLDAQENLLMNSGAVYAFHLSSGSGEWELFQKITNPEGPETNDNFGGAVAMYDGLALIGNSTTAQSPRLSNAAFVSPSRVNGSVYVYQFKHHKWKHIQTLRGDQANPTTVVLGPLYQPQITPPTADLGDGFGLTVGLTKKWAVIGAPLETASPAGTPRSWGAAYVYSIHKHDGKKKLTRRQKLNSTDVTTQGFGFNASIKKNTLLVSDPLHTGPAGQFQGAFYAYKLDDGVWKLNQIVYHPEAGPSLYFGVGLGQSKKYVSAGSQPGSLQGTFSQFALVLESFAPVPANNGQAAIYRR